MPSSGTIARISALAVIVVACLYSDVLAIEPLRGSASYRREPGFSARVYYPRPSVILRADRLAEAYKLKAAESLYRQVLRQDPRSPGAWNGLGKIAYYQTTSSNQNLRDQTDALYKTAIQDFQTALRYQPGFVEARANLAALYMEQGRMDEAEEALSIALRLSPHDGRVLARRGEWLVRQGRYTEALPGLKRAIKLNPADDAAHYYLAVALAGRNELDAALAQLQSALWRNPKNAPVHYQMGLIYEKQGNGAAAVESYQKALALKPELLKAREQLATYLEAQGDTGAALAEWKRLRETAPDHWDLTKHAGQLSIQNGQPDVAIRLYRDWLEQHPEDQARVNPALAAAKTELARLKLRDEDLVSQGEAKRYAEQALRYQPNNFEARLIDVRLDRQMGNSASSIAGLEPGMVDVAIRKPAEQPYQSYERGRLLLARYQFDEAERAFREARLSGEGNRSQMVFGELFLTLGLPDLANEAFQSVLKRLPGNASAKLGLGKAAQAKSQSRILLAEAGMLNGKANLEAAIGKVQEALQLDAKNAEAYYKLGQLREACGETGPAADAYYAYTHLEPNGDRAEHARRKVEALRRKLTRSQTGKI